MGLWHTVRRWIACTVLVHYTFFMCLEPIVWASHHTLHVQVRKNRVLLQAFETEWDEPSSTFRPISKTVSSTVHSSKPVWGDLCFDLSSKTLTISKHSLTGKHSSTSTSLRSSRRSKTQSSLAHQHVDVLSIETDQPLALSDLELLSILVCGPHQTSTPKVMFKSKNTFQTSFFKVKGSEIAQDAELIFKHAPSLAMKWSLENPQKVQLGLHDDLMLDHILYGGSLTNKGRFSLQSDRVDVFLERLTNQGTLSGLAFGALNLYTPSPLDNRGTIALHDLTLQGCPWFHNHGLIQGVSFQGSVKVLENHPNATIHVTTLDLPAQKVLNHEHAILQGHEVYDEDNALLERCLTVNTGLFENQGRCEAARLDGTVEVFQNTGSITGTTGSLFIGQTFVNHRSATLGDVACLGPVENHKALTLRTLKGFQTFHNRGLFRGSDSGGVLSLEGGPFHNHGSVDASNLHVNLESWINAGNVTLKGWKGQVRRLKNTGTITSSSGMLTVIDEAFNAYVLHIYGMQGETFNNKDDTRAHVLGFETLHNQKTGILEGHDGFLRLQPSSIRRFARTNGVKNEGRIQSDHLVLDLNDLTNHGSIQSMTLKGSVDALSQTPGSELDSPGGGLEVRSKGINDGVIALQTLEGSGLMMNRQTIALQNLGIKTIFNHGLIEGAQTPNGKTLTLKSHDLRNQGEILTDTMRIPTSHTRLHNQGIIRHKHLRSHGVLTNTKTWEGDAFDLWNLITNTASGQVQGDRLMSFSHLRNQGALIFQTSDVKHVDNEGSFESTHSLMQRGLFENYGAIITPDWHGEKDSQLVNHGAITGETLIHDQVTNEPQGEVMITERTNVRVMINRGLWSSPILAHPFPSSLDNQGTITTAHIAYTDIQNHGLIQHDAPLHLQGSWITHSGQFKTPTLTMSADQRLHSTSSHPWPETVEATVTDFIHDATGVFQVRHGFLTVQDEGENRGMLSLPLLQGQGTFTNRHKVNLERVALRSLHNTRPGQLMAKQMNVQRLHNEGRTVAQKMTVEDGLQNAPGALIASELLKASKKFQNEGEMVIQHHANLQAVTSLTQKGMISTEILTLPPIALDQQGTIRSKTINGNNSTLHNTGTIQAETLHLRTLENLHEIEAHHIQTDHDLVQGETGTLRTHTLDTPTLINKGPITAYASVATHRALENQEQGVLTTPTLKASGLFDNRGQMTLREGHFQAVTDLTQKGTISAETLTFPPLAFVLEGTLKAQHLNGPDTTIHNRGKLKGQKVYLKRLQNEGDAETDHLNVTELDNHAPIQGMTAKVQTLHNAHEVLFQVLHVEHVHNAPQGLIHTEQATLTHATNQGEMVSEDMRVRTLTNEGVVSSPILSTDEQLINRGTIKTAHLTLQGDVDNHALMEIDHPEKAHVSFEGVKTFQQKGQIQIQKGQVHLPQGFTNEGTLLMRDVTLGQGSITNKGTIQATRTDTGHVPIENHQTLVLGPGDYTNPITNTGTLSLLGSDFSLNVKDKRAPSHVLNLINSGTVESDGILYVSSTLGGKVKTTQDIYPDIDANTTQLMALNNRWTTGGQVIVQGGSLAVDQDIQLLYPLTLMLSENLNAHKKRITTTHPLRIQTGGGISFEESLLYGPEVALKAGSSVVFVSSKGAFRNLHIQAPEFRVTRTSTVPVRQDKPHSGKGVQGFYSDQTGSSIGGQLILETTHYTLSSGPSEIQVLEDLDLECSRLINQLSTVRVGQNLIHHGKNVLQTEIPSLFHLEGIDSQTLDYMDIKSCGTTRYETVWEWKEFKRNVEKTRTVYETKPSTSTTPSQGYFKTERYTDVETYRENVPSQRTVFYRGYANVLKKGRPIHIHSPDPSEHGKTVIPAIVQVGDKMTVSADLVSIMNSAISASDLDVSAQNMLFKQTAVLQKKLNTQGNALMLDLGHEAEVMQEQGLLIPNVQGSLTFTGETLPVVDPAQYGVVGEAQVPYLSEDALDHAIIQALSTKLGRLHDAQGRPILSMLQNMRQQGLALQGYDEQTMISSRQVQNIQDHFLVMVRQQIRDQVFAVPRLFLDMKTLVESDSQHEHKRLADLQAHTLSIKASHDVVLENAWLQAHSLDIQASHISLKTMPIQAHTLNMRASKNIALKNTPLEADTLNIHASQDVTLQDLSMRIHGDADIRAEGHLLQESLVTRHGMKSIDNSLTMFGSTPSHYHDTIETPYTVAVGGNLTTHGGLSNTRRGTAFVVDGDLTQTSDHIVEELPVALESYAYEQHDDSDFWSDTTTITTRHETTHVPNVTMVNKSITSQAPQVHLQGSQIMGREGIRLGQGGSDIRVTPITNTQTDTRIELGETFFSSAESSAHRTGQRLVPSTLVTEREGSVVIEGQKAILEGPQIRTGLFQDLAHHTVISPGLTQNTMHATSSSSNVLGSSSGQESGSEQRVYPATLDATDMISLNMQPESTLHLRSTHVAVENDLHIEKEIYVESAEQEKIQHDATHEAQGLMIPSLKNPLANLPFASSIQGVQGVNDVWGGVRATNGLLTDGNLALNVVNQGVMSPSVLQNLAGRFTTLSFTNQSSGMSQSRRKDEPTVMTAGRDITIQTEKTHLKGQHKAGRHVRVRARTMTSQPLLEEVDSEQWSESSTLSFNPISLVASNPIGSLGFSMEEGTGRSHHKVHTPTTVEAHDTMDLEVGEAELEGTQLTADRMQGRIEHLTLRHTADEHEVEEHHSSHGINLSFIGGMPVPLPSIAENDNEEDEHVIRKGRSAFHANDNVLNIDDFEEIEDDEYHHHDESSLAFHPGEIVSLVQNFSEFAQNFEVFTQNLRPAVAYKDPQEQKVMEAYHKNQVNDAKETLTELAERLHESRREAVDRVLHRLEKENARRQDKGQRPLTALDPEVNAFVNEATEQHTERATHQIQKVASYVQETTTDGDIQAVALQAVEHAHNDVEQDRSVIRNAAVSFLKGLGDVFSIKEVNASEDMGLTPIDHRRHARSPKQPRKPSPPRLKDTAFEKSSSWVGEKVHELHEAQKNKKWEEASTSDKAKIVGGYGLDGIAWTGKVLDKATLGGLSWANEKLDQGLQKGATLVRRGVRTGLEDTGLVSPQTAQRWGQNAGDTLALTGNIVVPGTAVKVVSKVGQIAKVATKTSTMTKVLKAETQALTKIETIQTKSEIVQPKMLQKGETSYSDISKMGRYIKQIEQVNQRPLPKVQLEKLKDRVRNEPHQKLSKEAYDAHTETFTRTKKNQLISEWEQKTGEQWSTYKEPVYKKDGTVYKKVGEPYDAHHVIPQELGGPHKWWNITPAPFPGHQTVVHGSGAIIKDIIKNVKN